MKKLMATVLTAMMLLYSAATLPVFAEAMTTETGTETEIFLQMEPEKSTEQEKSTEPEKSTEQEKSAEPEKSTEQEKSAELKKSTALKKGDCIGIVAPAYPARADGFTQTVLFLRQQGYQVKIAESCTAKDRYLAGEDELRARDINAFFADDEVDAILCIRGGYGSARILDLLDYDMIAQHPKLLIGYSDITALHIALMQESGLVTVQGPMASNFCTMYSDAVKALFLTEIEPEDLLDENASALVIDSVVQLFSEGNAAVYEGTALEYTVKQFLHGISSAEPIGEIELPEGYKLKTVIPGTAEGLLVGGNLTLVASLVGTAYELQGDHMILFLEEIGESAYRVDRMMNQLWQSGLLSRVDGLLIGDLVDMTNHATCTCLEVIEEYARKAGKPCISGLPAGHGNDNMFMPFGVPVRITANEDGSASVYFPESALEPAALPVQPGE